MDIKEQIEKMLASVTQDAKLKDKFLKDPVDTVKDVLGGALSEDIIEKIVAGVKAKLSADAVSDAAGALGKLFGK